MASEEIQSPDPMLTPHLHFLVPFIRGFRHLHSFTGHSADFAHNDQWLEEFVKNFDKDVFFKYVSDNLEGICSELNSRWLLSILHCYGDGHPDKEVQLQGMAAANFIELDRMHISSLHTLKLNREEFAENFHHYRNKVEVLDGLILYIGHADVLNNFYYRSEKLITHREIDKIYRTLTARFCNSWLSLHAGMIMNSGRETTRKVRDKQSDQRDERIASIEKRIQKIKEKLANNKN